MITQTQILPDFCHIVGTLENRSIGGQFKIDFYKVIKLTGKLSDKGTFTYLSGTSDDKWLMIALHSPLSQLSDQFSFVHIVHAINLVQRYEVFLKHRQKIPKIFLKHRQGRAEIFLKHRQERAKRSKVKGMRSMV